MTNPITSDSEAQSEAPSVDSEIYLILDTLWDEASRQALENDEAADLPLDEAKAKINRLIVEASKTNGETSDGYHTFNELYEFRLLYNAALFNTWSIYSEYPEPVKSWRHSDGELAFGGGWFVVSVQLPTGQITNHYEEKDWGLFKIREVEKAPKWDGHTAQDVAKRLREYLLSNNLSKGEQK